MSTFNYFTEVGLVHVGGTARVQVGTHMATSGLCFYRPSMPGRSQAVQVGTVVEVASGMTNQQCVAQDDELSHW